MTESGSPPSRGRGRPRAGADPQGPLADWISGLSPTAIHVVNVGRRVLVEDGFEAVTIEHVALEANVSPATIRRQFVSKSGLLYAIFSRLEAEAWEKLVADVQPISPAEARLHAYISGLGALIEDPSNGVGLTEVLAHGLRDPILRQKMAADYDLARDGTLELGGLEGGDADAAARRRALASLIVAAIDGLSLQVAADPDGVDEDLAFALLADMVRLWLAAQPGG